MFFHDASALFALQATAANDESSSGFPVFLLFVVWGIAIAVFVRQRKDFDVSYQTSASPEDAMAQAIRCYSSRGFSVTSNTGSQATFYKNLRPGCLPAILWSLLGLMPGLIYLFIGGRDLTSTVSVRSMGTNLTSVQISGNAKGFGAMDPVNKLKDSLPPVSGGHF